MTQQCYGYGTHELAGFLSYGHAYGLLQCDKVRDYLLLLNSLMAHQYARGFWTAPETRPLKPNTPVTAYCTPAQLVVPRMLRWMLVFEDPATNVLWLAKATPRYWLADGQRIAVEGAPTRMGKVSFAISSRLTEGRVEAELQLPASASTASVKLRLRVPVGYTLSRARLNGQDWRGFRSEDETVSLPEGSSGTVELETLYRRK